MVKGQFRADPNDRKNWSASTRLDAERFRRTYLRIAKEAGQDPASPDEMWLAVHLHNVRKTSGRAYAVKMARNFAYALEDLEGPPLVDGDLIRSILAGTEPYDPLSCDFDPSKRSGLIRARALADANHSSRTVLGYHRWSIKWLERCENAGVDPLLAPAELVTTWLGELATAGYATQTISNARNALSHLFRKNHVADIARTPEVVRLFEGLERERPAAETLSYSASERRRILEGLEDVGLGVRDRSIVLVTAFTEWGCERIAMIHAEHVTITDEEVVIESGGREPAACVSRHADPVLDLGYWLLKLIESVGGSGPLFRAWVPRVNVWSSSALAYPVLTRTLRRACKRSQVPSANASGRLRALFRDEKRTVASDIVVAHYDGRRTLRLNYDQDDRTLNVMMRRHRSRRHA